MAKTLQMCSLDVFFCSFTIFSFKLQFAHCYTWSKWMIIFYVMVVMCRTCLSEMPSNDSLIDWLINWLTDWLTDCVSARELTFRVNWQNYWELLVLNCLSDWGLGPKLASSTVSLEASYLSCINFELTTRVAGECTLISVWHLLAC